LPLDHADHCLTSLAEESLEQILVRASAKIRACSEC
jgi:hypothetical protein